MKTLTASLCIAVLSTAVIGLFWHATSKNDSYKGRYQSAEFCRAVVVKATCFSCHSCPSSVHAQLEIEE